MAIESRILPAGTILRANYKKQTWRVLVLETEEGKKGYQLIDPTGGGTEIYKSPSAAGSAVMGGVACNGWRFWSIEGEEPVTPPKEQEAKEASPAKRVFKNLKRTPNQKGVEEGQERWFCSACQKGFTVPAKTTPEACPEGHPAEVEDELAISE